MSAACPCLKRFAVVCCLKMFHNPDCESRDARVVVAVSGHFVRFLVVSFPLLTTDGGNRCLVTKWSTSPSSASSRRRLRMHDWRFERVGFDPSHGRLCLFAAPPCVCEQAKCGQPGREHWSPSDHGPSPARVLCKLQAVSWSVILTLVHLPLAK